MRGLSITISMVLPEADARHCENGVIALLPMSVQEPFELEALLLQTPDFTALVWDQIEVWERLHSDDPDATIPVSTLLKALQAPLTNVANSQVRVSEIFARHHFVHGPTGQKGTIQ